MILLGIPKQRNYVLVSLVGADANLESLVAAGGAKGPCGGGQVKAEGGQRVHQV